MEKRSRKKDKNKENVVASAVEKEKKKAGITELDFKQLRICLQQILNKINGLMLPLIKNCKNDKVCDRLRLSFTVSTCLLRPRCS